MINIFSGNASAVPPEPPKMFTLNEMLEETRAQAIQAVGRTLSLVIEATEKATIKSKAVEYGAYPYTTGHLLDADMFIATLREELKKI